MIYSKQDFARELEEAEKADEGRSAFRRDFCRLLHSPSFRRLQGKTQLFPSDESDFFRNRLTHSLEVAQIAKGIAQNLNSKIEFFKKNPIDLDLVEFAGIAHDLGHPPFGHNGEKALDDKMKGFGGFEGNAQTLRILSRLEKKIFSPDSDENGLGKEGEEKRLGLNLSYRSLASILKYDRKIPERREGVDPLVKGYYSTEESLVKRIKEKIDPREVRGAEFKTIECAIMDIADDIAYSTYDFEDSMKGGFTHPLDLFLRLGDEKLLTDVTEKVRKEVPDIKKEDIFEAIFNIIPIAASAPSEQNKYQELLSQSQIYRESILLASNGRYRSGFSSELVGRFIQGITADPLCENPALSAIKVERSIKISIESFKHLNYIVTILSPRLRVVEHRGYDIVSQIFEALSDAKKGELLLPDDIRQVYRKLPDKNRKMRLICDFIAGMTDRYAAEFHGRLFGTGTTIFKPL
ncbi:dGTP triphosphohydrolase [Alcaligenes faecalis]|uniref:dGTP triphosphohydrolase n=1 Tax=Alcaligenes faecalis TaxID=511 RepID=UPI000F0B15CD|nr:dNTP triphosphohydrolase [Alcaligenes faecalis]AYR21999.1 dNTP triphosphohydrolase [Alcaligenes faecalis]